MYSALLSIALCGSLAAKSYGTQLVLQEPSARPYVLQQNWGAYAPYFPLDEYVFPPIGCEVTQANILQRHGARYPLLGPAASIAYAVLKLQRVASFKDPSLDFIHHFTLNPGINDLVLFGAAQSLASGAETYHRYKSIVDEDNIPFVRATSSDRVVKSATNWTYGKFLGRKQSPFQPCLGNDTLHNACKNIGKSYNQTDTWREIFTAPIVQRLNNAAPGADLTPEDVYNLMSLCAFDSVATDAISDWCGLFDKEEWKWFEYEMDLNKYYGTGYGQPLGPVEGVGYINELIARLTSTPVNDSTQTNSTLDSSPLTFPLNRTIYADFSHDNQLIAIFSAMGLFKQTRALNPTNPNSGGPSRSWVTSRSCRFQDELSLNDLHVGNLPVQPKKQRRTFGY
ncbi:hypothetical protein D9757_009309 [Collybiopsis confluens]|uniref:Uncharacterized protein n=1 Tax=Collybiopsis confluens TaxID=2823264 RepID=A0A8H5M0C9_9AGAR|nr:hypothetical protein D9757_009309 [Collybiopsis confluens]